MPATYIRGYNPVWLFDDLNGLILDDTYYLFILQNTLPYLPATDIYQDPDGNINWSTPIQFLANGTLPNNIYFNPESVYRLEVRDGPTQSDALIYLVENYVPGVDVVAPGSGASPTENQITNPQFATVLFDASTQLTISTATTTTIAPGWSVITVGTGTLIVTQAQFTGTSNIPGNASYGISLNNAGFSSVTLVQTFQNNGELWTSSSIGNDGSVALSLVAYDQAGNIPLTGTIAFNDGTENTQIFDTPINVVANVYGGVAIIPQSTNTANPANSYTQILISFAVSGIVTLTNIQLIGNATTQVPYIQNTIERQIDQTYHWASPIVPVGTVIDYYGFGSPAHYLLCDGTNTYSRSTYWQLFSALTLVENITQVTSQSFTGDATNLGIGMWVEGAGIPVGTYIDAISAYAPGATIHVNQVTTSTGTISARFFSCPQGDGSTTFGTPDLRGYVIAGVGGNSLFLPNTTPNTLGADAGALSVTLNANQIAPHTHTASVALGQSSSSVSGPGTFSPVTTGPTSVTVNANVPSPSLQPVNIVQPTTFAYKYIRYE